MPSMSHAGPVGIAGALLAAGFFLLGYTNHSIYLIAAVFIAYGVWLVVRAFLHPAKPPVDLNWMGDIVPETLSLHNGQDPYLPLLMAVKGRVYDVSKGRDFYGPGGAYSAFAGRAVDRALAKMSLNEEDCTANVDDCTSKELGILQEWADKLDKKYKVVGRLVEPKKLTLEELRQYDGSDEKLPMLLAIRGRVFDVSRGSQYYGPNGAYPFAGYEVARALATMSTNEADFTDCLDDLTQYDRDQLRNWEELFRSKYPLVGVVVPSEGRKAASQ